ncbi:mechanosensitive ion channel family protein [Candidatus Saccharibacteria bacterium]|jgi:small-conductance mechanosensitive channel|nr:mechanosensitive ion channel family protein [Candidatus Saccharibacteria bacterium]
MNNFAQMSDPLNETINAIFATPVLRVALILVAMFVAQKVIDFVTNRYFDRAYEAQAKKNKIKISKKRYDTLSRAFRQVASFIIWIIGIFAILSVFNVNVAALLAGAGVAGVAFGIAGKDIIMDLYVGMMVLLEDQYRVGDVITIDQDHGGTVEEITLRTVRLRDIDGNAHIVPHSLARAIINKTYGYSNVTVELGVAYDADIEKVKQLINSVGQEMALDELYKGVFMEPIEYKTMLRFDESQMTVRAQGKVQPGKQWSVASDFRVRIKQAFDSNGIEIPFPQRVIRQINEDASKATKKPNRKK